MQRLSFFFLGLAMMAASLLFMGCSSKSGPGGRCPGGGYSCGQLCTDANPPSVCGLDCSDDACPIGFYCGADDTCTADCSADSALCGAGTCNVSMGVCMPPTEEDAGVGDGGLPDNGPRPDNGPLVDLGPQPDNSVCARVSVEATRVTPNVIFLIDRSGSMQWELDLSDGAQCPLNSNERDCYESNTESIRDLSRWRELRSTLVGTSPAPAAEGLLADLQDQVRFGALTYRRRNGVAECGSINLLSPIDIMGTDRIGVIAPGSDPSARDVIAGNAADTRYLDLEPSGGTPTGPAIDYMVSNLDPAITSSDDPTILILATDGDPTRSLSQGGGTDYCAGFDNYTTDPEAWSVAAVQRAYTAGIRTFVLAVADEDDLAQDHVNNLANAGIGADPDAMPAAMSWRVNDVEALNAALTAIIGDEISCTIELNGSVPTWSTDPCAGGTIEIVEGTVRTPLACSPGNGWQLTGPSTVEIMGTSCLQLKAATNATLDASFPCDTVIFD